MRKLILISILFLNFITYGQTHLYENPKFDEIAGNHKIIAVIPFSSSVELRPKQMKKLSDSDLKKLEKDEGYSIQSAMYSWFLKRKKRGALKIDIQDISKTNAVLLKKKISLNNYKEYTPKELADILEVDAIIMGDFSTNKPVSELVGVFWGNTNSATVNLNIYNAKDGELLVNYNKNVKGSLGSSPDDLINKIMRKASRRIAYTKD
ncbi:hypothetical protein [Aquimarina algiphila]|uniref:hypothetical protein n=1 Tax=Aquimarina algiphila TaxID=2047982 RepID=UPI00232C2727|nr:hypothetical protein [Aquimarina algiphila]